MKQKKQQGATLAGRGIKCGPDETEPPPPPSSSMTTGEREREREHAPDNIHSWRRTARGAARGSPRKQSPFVLFFYNKKKSNGCWGGRGLRGHRRLRRRSRPN
ncbi:unnamed protein product [Boreogadus saida]